MQATATRYGVNYSQVYSSPLSRCSRFARAWCAQHQNLDAVEDFSLIEANLGAWEGLEIEQVKMQEPVRLQKFWKDPLNNSPEGAETLLQMQQRIASFVERKIEQHQGEQLLLVSHSGLIRAFIMSILGANDSAWRTLQVPHGGLTRVRYYHQQGYPDWCSLEFHGLKAVS